MAKKGRQNKSDKQPNPRKLQRASAGKSVPKASDDLIKADVKEVRKDAEDEPKATGLINLGNTCFFNAAIQVRSERDFRLTPLVQI